MTPKPLTDEETIALAKQIADLLPEQMQGQDLAEVLACVVFTFSDTPQDALLMAIAIGRAATAQTYKQPEVH